jgi:hypothetical protein
MAARWAVLGVPAAPEVRPQPASAPLTAVTAATAETVVPSPPAATVATAALHSALDQTDWAAMVVTAGRPVALEEPEAPRAEATAATAESPST